MATDPSSPAGGTAAGSGATWADIAQDALHYAAAAAIVGVVGFFFWNGKLSQDLFVLTLTGAGSLVGIKLKNG